MKNGFSTGTGDGTGYSGRNCLEVPKCPVVNVCYVIPTPSRQTTCFPVTILSWTEDAVDLSGGTAGFTIIDDAYKTVKTKAIEHTTGNGRVKYYGTVYIGRQVVQVDR